MPTIAQTCALNGAARPQDWRARQRMRAAVIRRRCRSATTCRFLTARLHRDNVPLFDGAVASRVRAAPRRHGCTAARMPRGDEGVPLRRAYTCGRANAHRDDVPLFDGAVASRILPSRIDAVPLVAKVATRSGSTSRSFSHRSGSLLPHLDTAHSEDEAFPRSWKVVCRVFWFDRRGNDA